MSCFSLLFLLIYLKKPILFYSIFLDFFLPEDENLSENDGVEENCFETVYLEFLTKTKIFKQLYLKYSFWGIILRGQEYRELLREQ